VDCIQQNLKADGVSGLYAGCAISATRYFFYRGFQFGMYDVVKQTIIPNLNTDNPILLRLTKLCIAQTVTGTASTMAFPLDTVRRRLQMDTGHKKKVYKGAVHCFQKILRDEGGAAFYNGAVANIMKGFGSALVLVLYDDVKLFIESKFLNDHWEEV